MESEGASITHETSPIDIIVRATRYDDSSLRANSCPQHLQHCLLALLDTTPGLVMVWNRLGRLHYLNVMGRSMLGISRSDNLVTYRVTDFYSSRAYEKHLEQAVPACLKSGVWRGETTLIDRRNNEIAVSQLLLAHRNDELRDRDVTIFSCIAWDIRDHKSTERSLRYQATHDALTGLPNRALLMDRLKQAVLTAQRHGYLVAVLFLDLNNFKVINDELGHEIGNAVLRELGKRLTSIARAEDTVARYGGDEFIVVVPDLESPGDCDRVVSKIEEALCEPFVANGQELVVQASIGVAQYPHDGEDAESLLRRADSMMYRTKRAGKHAKGTDSGASSQLRSVVMN